jgi:hypothetical protein
MSVTLLGNGYLPPLPDVAEDTPLFCVWLDEQGYLAGVFAVACRLEHVHPFSAEQLAVVEQMLRDRAMPYRVEPYTDAMWAAHDRATECRVLADAGDRILGVKVTRGFARLQLRPPAERIVLQCTVGVTQ